MLSNAQCSSSFWFNQFDYLWYRWHFPIFVLNLFAYYELRLWLCYLMQRRWFFSSKFAINKYVNWKEWFHQIMMFFFCFSAWYPTHFSHGIAQINIDSRMNIRHMISAENDRIKINARPILHQCVNRDGWVESNHWIRIFKIVSGLSVFAILFFCILFEEMISQIRMKQMLRFWGEWFEHSLPQASVSCFVNFGMPSNFCYDWMNFIYLGPKRISRTLWIFHFQMKCNKLKQWVDFII